MKNKDINIKTTIVASFGSEFQHKIHTETLRIMINAWSSHVKYANKKNKVSIEEIESINGKTNIIA